MTPTESALTLPPGVIPTIATLTEQSFTQKTTTMSTVTTLSETMQLDSPNSNDAAVIGGAVGGALALIGIVLVLIVVLVVLKKRKDKQNGTIGSSVGPQPVYNTIPINNYGAPPRTSEIVERTVDTYGASGIVERTVDTYGAPPRTSAGVPYGAPPRTDSDEGYGDLELMNGDDGDQRKLSRKRTRSSRRRRRARSGQPSSDTEYKPLPINAQQLQQLQQ
jgi:hypothetical protein